MSRLRELVTATHCPEGECVYVSNVNISGILRVDNKFRPVVIENISISSDYDRKYVMIQFLYKSNTGISNSEAHWFGYVVEESCIDEIFLDEFPTKLGKILYDSSTS